MQILIKSGVHGFWPKSGIRQWTETNRVLGGWFGTSVTLARFLGPEQMSSSPVWCQSHVFPKLQVVIKPNRNKYIDFLFVVLQVKSSLGTYWFPSFFFTYYFWDQWWVRTNLDVLLIIPSLQWRIWGGGSWSSDGARVGSAEIFTNIGNILCRFHHQLSCWKIEAFLL